MDRMGRRPTVRVSFDDPAAAERFLASCRRRGLDASPETGAGALKRNGPALAAWLTAHPGWHEVGRSRNRMAAYKQARKIRLGERRGFERGGFDADHRADGGEWVVVARRRPRRAAATDGMEPLF